MNFTQISFVSVHGCHGWNLLLSIRLYSLWIYWSHYASVIRPPKNSYMNKLFEPQLKFNSQGGSNKTMLLMCIMGYAIVLYIGERFNISLIKVQITFMGHRGAKMINSWALRHLKLLFLTQTSYCTSSHSMFHSVWGETHSPPFPYQRYQHGCQDARADILKCLWSPHGMARLKWGGLGASCVDENMWLYGRRFACQRCSMLQLHRARASLFRQQRLTGMNYTSSMKNDHILSAPAALIPFTSCCIYIWR